TQLYTLSLHDALPISKVLGDFLRDVMKLNLEARNFRVFAPDELASNRLQAIFEVTNRAWNERTIPEDDHLSVDGRVMEVLSEHRSEEHTSELQSRGHL